MKTLSSPPTPTTALMKIAGSLLALAITLAWSSAALAGPDLATRLRPKGSVEVAPSSTIEIEGRVVNRGQSDAAACKLMLKRSQDENVSQSDETIASKRVRALPAAIGSSIFAAIESVTHKLDLTVPDEPGTYYYGLCVEEVPGEEVTDNNCTPALVVIVASGR